jgi:hypothetical protein
MCHPLLSTGAPATQPPLECVEELYTGLLGFYSPHVVLYAAAALQAVKGQGTAGNTSSLIRYGVLPLVGRPENLQVGVLSGKGFLLGRGVCLLGRHTNRTLHLHVCLSGMHVCLHIGNLLQHCTSGAILAGLPC